MRILTSLVAGLAFASACTSTPSPEEQQLESALATWSDHSSYDYSFTWRQSCECSPDTVRPIRITVHNDAITSAVYVDTQLPVDPTVGNHLLTIDGVFARIQDAIAGGAYAVSVLYDANVGHPTSVGIDYDAALADEEFSLVISDVTFDVAQDASCGG